MRQILRPPKLILTSSIISLLRLLTSSAQSITSPLGSARCEHVQQCQFIPEKRLMSRCGIIRRSYRTMFYTQKSYQIKIEIKTKEAYLHSRVIETCIYYTATVQLQSCWHRLVGCCWMVSPGSSALLKRCWLSLAIIDTTLIYNIIFSLSAKIWFCSVGKNPGTMAFTRMPSQIRSHFIDCMNAVKLKDLLRLFANAYMKPHTHTDKWLGNAAIEESSYNNNFLTTITTHQAKNTYVGRTVPGRFRLSTFWISSTFVEISLADNL